MTEFIRKTLASPEWRARLLEAGEKDVFFETALAAAGKWGLEISEEDLRETERRNRREWTERHLL